jgi:hypothetical protein
MKKIKLVILTSIITCFLVLNSGCAAVHTGYMTNSAALSQANFFYAKRGIKGVSTVEYFFGIGGLKKETLVDDAKMNMIASYSELGENQTLANLTVNFKTSSRLFGLSRKVTCTITADVVEFKENESRGTEGK